jgi:hypothetical protein
MSKEAPDPLDFREPVLCTTPLFWVNERAVKNKALKILQKTDYFFGKGLDHLVRRAMPEFEVKDFGLVAYGQEVFTPRHLDGAMANGFLTLLEGRKTWTIFGPGDKVKYVVHQEAGQTLYIPAGFSHEVKSDPPRSIAYNGVWEVPTPLALSLFLKNRKFVRSSPPLHKEGVMEDMKNVHGALLPRPPRKKKNETKVDSFMGMISKAKCKMEQTSTSRRRIDGRMRTRGRRARLHLQRKKHNKK